MTRNSVLPLSDDRLNDWLRVYNDGNDNTPNFKPLTKEELKALIKKGSANPDKMYLGLEGAKPTAVARFIGSEDAHTAFLSDISILPDYSEGLQALTTHMMEWAREIGAKRVVAWASFSSIRIPDILSEFTFDPRRVLVELKRTKGDSLSIDERLIERVVSWDEKGPTLRMSALFGGLYARPLELYELRDEAAYQWEPRFILPSITSDRILAVAYRSEANRTLGWIDLTPLPVGSDKSERPDSSLISHLADRLFLDGVNEIRTEVDGDLLEKQPFMKAGFETIKTHMEMELVLSYESEAI
ncbi:MAG: GNAT family N-acetyltransferase [Candidatus Thorarchaeota archaeon]